MEYDYGSFAGGVWSNFPLKDKVDGQSDPEFDFYGSYSMDVVKDTLSLQPGVTIYTYPNAKKANGFYKATFEPNLALHYTVGGVKFTPKIYYDFVLKGATAELTAAYTVPLKDLNTELDFTGTYGTFKWTSAAADTTPDIKNWGDYYLLGVAAPYQVTKDSKITVGWAYTKGSSNFFKQGTAGKVATQVARPDPLVAPFTKNQSVGSLKVLLGDQQLAELPLVALEPVEQAGVVGRAWDAVRLWIK